MGKLLAPARALREIPGTMPHIEDQAKTLLVETRDELARADDKATTLLAVNGILIAAVLAGIIAGDFAPGALSSWREPAFWCGAVAVLLSEALLCAAVFPQVWHPRESPVPPRYFGHVARIGTTQELRDALAHDDATDRAVSELFVLARVAVRKYRLIAGAEVALAGGVVACAAAVLVDRA